MKHNIFGGTIGFPIKKDKRFFNTFRPITVNRISKVGLTRQ